MGNTSSMQEMYVEKVPKDLSDADLNWTENYALYEQPQKFSNSFFKDPKNNRLSYSKVNFWSDFNLVHYHKDALQPISGIEKGSSLDSIDNFDDGISIFKGLEQKPTEDQYCDLALSLVYSLEFNVPVIQLNAPDPRPWSRCPHLSKLDEVASVYGRTTFSRGRDAATHAYNLESRFDVDIDRSGYSVPFSFPADFGDNEHDTCNILSDISSFRQTKTQLHRLQTILSLNKKAVSAFGFDEVSGWAEQLLASSEKYD
ncbi:hypothetical protein AYI68_g3803 [Smittium mucronatum]|uniref:Uncharacterized protein n=1 Tax=Smittium mucronatum TaxID=133383 RepID=A0A1R0GYV7_9FUNG|nr:hypothetical protein AYI68_g3803 [Smittium mucronatum]